MACFGLMGELMSAVDILSGEGFIYFTSLTILHIHATPFIFDPLNIVTSLVGWKGEGG